MIGSGIPVHDAPAKAVGSIQYTADIKKAGMLYAKLLLSSRARAKIVAVDTAEAEAHPGVRCVFSTFNSPGTRYNSAKRFEGQKVPEDEQLIPSVVRFIGDRVAMVAADSAQAADRALKLIKVRYEDLPALFSIEEALEEGSFPIHPGGNKNTEMVTQGVRWSRSCGMRNLCLRIRPPLRR